MKTTPRYNLTGLIALLGIGTLLIGWILMLILPSIRYATWGILAFGAILLGTAFIIDFRRVGKAIVSRRGKFGAGTTIMVSVFIGIILLVNAISTGSYHRFDLTGVAQFTLTSQTKETLNNLETPVQTILFTTPLEVYGISNYITNLLIEYQNQSDQLEIIIIDAEEHPDQAEEYGVSTYPTVIFESQNRYRAVLPQDIIVLVGEQYAVDAEHAFTSAILEVTGTVQKKVYFLTGHGEDNIYTNYVYAADGLRDNLFQVETVDLIDIKAIPDDCATLIIAGPQTSLESSEVEVIQQYLENSGQVLIMVNPNRPPEMDQLLSYWGTEIGDGTIIDTSSYVAPSIDNPSVSRNSNAFGLSAMYFPGATAIIPHPEYVPTLIQSGEGNTIPEIIWISEDSDIQMYMLLWTSEDSWLEKDFNPGETPDFDEETELEGPLALGFLIFTTPTDETEEGSALIVLGDSDFASNQHFYNGNNSDLFLSCVNWLTVGEELISIDRKVVSFRRLIVGPEEEAFIKFSSIGLLPLIVLITGIVVWWRRR